MLYINIISLSHVYFCDLIALGGLVQPLAALRTPGQSTIDLTSNGHGVHVHLL